ncbi:hypothetical protein [Streptomyces sp. NPDC088146]|uniref:hypothetical protein n=1 Tax=Streptomyces sp. NPDC088146 TaxID=3365829 RepID=UPI0037FFD79F
MAEPRELSRRTPETETAPDPDNARVPIGTARILRRSQAAAGEAAAPRRARAERADR